MTSLLMRAVTQTAFVPLSLASIGERPLASWIFIIVAIGSIPVAGAMARERNRPSREEQAKRAASAQSHDAIIDLPSSLLRGRAFAQYCGQTVRP
jgi:hypothetical protein